MNEILAGGAFITQRSVGKEGAEGGKISKTLHWKTEDNQFS